MGIASKIKTKYSTLPIGVKAAFWFTICNLLQKAVTMITLPIFTRLLTTEQYGTFTVYQSWYSIISIIVTLNLSGGVVNTGMVKYEDRRSRFISALQGLSTAVTMAFFIVYLIWHNFFNSLFQLSSVFILTMFIQLLFEPAYLFWAQRQRYEYRYKSLIAVTFIIALTSPILGVIAVVSTDYKSEARVISYALVQICVGLILYIVQACRGKTLFDKDMWKFALAFNLPLVPHYLSQMILGQSDRIMISRMVGDSQAAIYGVAYNLASVLSLLINAVNSSFVPSMYENIKNKKFESVRKTASFLALFMGVIISVFILFGPEIILLFTTKEYLQTKWIFPPVAASVFFTFLYVMFINVEFYYEKTKYVMVVSIVGAGLNVALNFFFIEKFGYIAAGYTTVFCYILFAVGHYALERVILKKKGITQPVFDGGKLLLYSIAVLVFMALCIFLYKYNVVRYVVIGIITVVALINYRKIIKVIKQALGK